MQENIEKIYVADIYLRLSKEDGDKEESDSIQNQRAMILDFLQTQPDIKINKIRIDDGRSGVDFNRPAFIEMIDDVKAGIVNCIICKDFSRFSRNYIEAGRYIQVLFPQTGVRFIAVGDHYDSSKVQGHTSHIIVPFKNMINDAYCADISMKVRSHLDVKRKRGDFVGAFAVYGYTKDTHVKNKLVIDDFAADVVRDIYKWKLEGMSAQGIADRLNQAGILSPMEYKKFLGLRYNTTFKVNTTAKWQSVTVKRILTNPVYIGTLEQGKRTKPNYKIRKTADVPKEQWICTPNAHDAIIEKNIFDTVQELLKQDTRNVEKGGKVFPLSGIILCGDCGGAMVRKTNTKNGVRYPYYVCREHRADKTFCTTHLISATECENAVFTALQMHTKSILDTQELLSVAENMAYLQNSVVKLTARLEAKEEELRRFNDFRLSLYESYREGILPKDDFISFKASYDEKIKSAEEVILQLQSEIESQASDEAQNNGWIDKFRQHNELRTLERKTVAELVDKVLIFEGGRIEVSFRYYNEFLKLKGVA
ncbi:MAG: recombinase family protein [Defluviitaleaceae bacterium]|nr:recombinase family protein [Defluviitaleaceae bacterium]